MKLLKMMDKTLDEQWKGTASTKWYRLTENYVYYVNGYRSYSLQNQLIRYSAAFSHLDWQDLHQNIAAFVGCAREQLRENSDVFLCSII